MRRPLQKAVRLRRPAVKKLQPSPAAPSSGLVDVLLAWEVGDVPCPTTSSPSTSSSSSMVSSEGQSWAETIRNDGKRSGVFDTSLSAVAPYFVHVAPPFRSGASDEELASARDAVANCFGVHAPAIRELLGWSNALTAIPAVSSMESAAMAEDEWVSALSVASPSRWLELMPNSALSQPTLQKALRAISTNAFFGQTFSECHDALVAILKRIGQKITASASFEEYDPFADASWWKGVRKLYLRSGRAELYCDTFLAALKNRRTAAPPNAELVEFFAVLPCRRETSLSKQQQWEKLLANLPVAVKLIPASKSSLLRLVMNCAVHLQRGGERDRVAEVLLSMAASAASQPGNQEARITEELVSLSTAFVTTCVAKLRMSNFSGDLDAILGTLSLAVALRASAPTAADTLEACILHELELSADSKSLRGPSRGCAETNSSVWHNVEGTAAQLLATLSGATKLDENRRRGVAQRIVKWAEQELQRVQPSLDLSIWHSPAVVKLLADPHIGSKTAVSALATSWVCGCGATNVGSHRDCVECSLKSGRPTFRCSSCNAMSESASGQCMACGHTHPIDELLAESRQWLCAPCGKVHDMESVCPCGARNPNALVPCGAGCGTMNRDADAVCSGCGALNARSDTHPKQPLLAVRCGECGDISVGTSPSGCCSSCNTAFTPHTTIVPYFQWKCTCGALNAPQRSECHACSARPSVNGKHPRDALLAAAEVRVCQACATANAKDAQSCMSCSQPLDLASVLVPGIPWTCHACGNTSAAHVGSSSATSCSSCGTARLDTSDFTEFAVWQCSNPSCSTEGDIHGFSCPGCGQLNPAVPPEDVSVWSCGSCKRVNHSWEAACSRKGCDGLQAEATHKFRHLRWICEGCNTVNDARNTDRCRRCRSKRPHHDAASYCTKCHANHIELECDPALSAAAMDSMESFFMGHFEQYVQKAKSTLGVSSKKH